ncbi:MAG: methyltransferase domain-containing protein [Myxococcota bacterium]
MDRAAVEFLKAAARRPLGVATVFPTSPALARRLLEPIGRGPPGHVVELGAGTGAITRHLAAVAPGQVTALEIDPEMARFLRTRIADVRVVCAPAEDLGRMVEPRTARAVVASLPWTMLTTLAQERIFAAVHAALVPGGVFATYMCLNAYLHPKARTFRARLHAWFPRVQEGTVEWRNLPPAVPWFAWTDSR